MKKMRFPAVLYIPFFMLLCLVSGCVASSVAGKPNAIVSPGVNTNAWATFAWYQEPDASAAAYGKEYSAGLHAHLRRAVEEELKKKGIVKATTGKPDVLVAFDVSVPVPLEKDNPEHFAEGFGYSYAYMSGYRYQYGHGGLPGYRAVDLYKSGTLIVDLVDPTANNLLWRGWAEGAISNFNAGYGTIQNQVEHVMQGLRKR